LAVGGVLVALTGLVAFGNSDELGSAAERAGYVFAAIGVPLLLAIAGRFVWVRFGSGRPPIMAWPWLLLITGILGVFFAFGRAGQQVEEDANASPPAREVSRSSLAR